ncbi:MAG: hypothetical protein IT182_12750 [Acidobacteria bacterium]|nr:hypothetical protein [Acidobacteriota bacterium]
MRTCWLLSLTAAVCAGFLLTAAPGLMAQARRPSTGATQKAAPKAAAKAAPKANPTVSLAGIQIAARSLGKARFGDTVAFGGKSGLTLALAVRVAPGTAILDIDDDESVVNAWTDDKETDLNVEPDWDSFPDYTEDQTGGITTVSTVMLPAAGAQQVTISGALAVTTAAGTRNVQAKKVALTKGTAFQLGAIAGSISEFDASDSGGSLAVRVTGSGLDAIKRIRFLDAAGTEIESETNGSMRSSSESEYSYTLKAKATTVTVEVELWQNLQTAAVPFSITAGVGSVR